MCFLPINCFFFQIFQKTISNIGIQRENKAFLIFYPLLNFHILENTFPVVFLVCLFVLCAVFPPVFLGEKKRGASGEIKSAINKKGPYNNSIPENNLKYWNSTLSVPDIFPAVKFPHPGKTFSCCFSFLVCFVRCFYPPVFLGGGKKKNLDKTNLP